MHRLSVVPASAVHIPRSDVIMTLDYSQRCTSDLVLSARLDNIRTSRNVSSCLSGLEVTLLPKYYGGMIDGSGNKGYALEIIGNGGKVDESGVKVVGASRFQ